MRTLLVTAVAFLIPTVGFVGVRAISFAGDDAPRCTGERNVRVAAAPEIAPTLSEIAERVDRDRVPIEGRCLTIGITPVEPVDMYGLLAGSEQAPAADLWVPDTLQWVQRTGLPADRTMALSPSVAASPVLAATSQRMADRIGSDGKDWRSLAGAADLSISDPERSGLALSALLGVRRSIAGGLLETDSDAQANRDRMGRTILGMLNNRVESLPAQLDDASAGPGAVGDRYASGLAHGVPTTEQRLLAYRDRHPNADAVPILPERGTVLLDYPLIALNGQPNVERLIRAGSVLMRHVDSDRGHATLREAGFRSFPDLRPPGGSDVGDVRLLHEAVPNDGDDVMRSWAAVAVDSKLLAIVDLSGSMDDVLPDGRRRIELARDAANGAVGYLPDTASIGLWGFSSQREGTNDYEPLLDVAPLDGAHRAEVGATLDDLPDQTYGGTGLYDTMLAGYQSMLDSYDSSRKNSVVLLTDGRNEDSGIGLDDLVRELERRTKPDLPVSTVLVGIGPEVDMTELRQIAKATGGRAEQAETPEDMERIILDALLLRQCEESGC